MNSPRFLVIILLAIAVRDYSFSQSTSAKTREYSSQGYLYTRGSGESFEPSQRISQYQKLVDERDFELSTTVFVPSINGGETVSREITEKSRRISENHIKVERTVRNTDTNGRLSPVEVVNEDIQLKGKTEEVHRSFYRPDINGKLVAHTVEQETTTQLSDKQRETTRAIYRPDIDGKFALAEVVEGTESRVSDTVSVKESIRKLKEANGRLVIVEDLKETTVRVNDKSHKKESVMRQADDNGRLVITDKVVEIQTENPDATRKYQRLLESRNINPQIRNVEGSRLILSERVTGEERKLPDGTIENTLKVETLDPFNLSDGLRVTEIVTETTKPVGNGKVIVERVIKTRDVNGNYVVSQKTSQILQETQ